MKKFTIEIATRATHGNIVPIEVQHRISIKKEIILQEDYDRMIKGLIPEQGTRIFIFFENNWFYIHKWIGGVGLFMAEIKKDKTEYYIDEFFVEGNIEKIIKPFNSDNDAENIRQFKYCIAKLIKHQMILENS